MTDLGMIARAAKGVTMDDIYVSLDALKDQQAEGFRHLNQRIDQLNQRFDTVVQMLLDLSKQISSQKNQ